MLQAVRAWTRRAWRLLCRLVGPASSGERTRGRRATAPAGALGRRRAFDLLPRPPRGPTPRPAGGGREAPVGGDDPREDAELDVERGPWSRGLRLAGGGRPGFGGPDGVDDPMLTDKERVRRLIDSEGGRMRQRVLVDRSGWTKSRVSRLVSAMEADGTVVKVTVGRENVVCLRGYEPNILPDATRPDDGSDTEEAADANEVEERTDAGDSDDAVSSEEPREGA